MFKFLNDAKAELEHVVWPTPSETKKYMYYNVTVIVVLALFLMVLGYAIQESLMFTRGQFPHDAITNTGSELATQGELDALADSLKQSIQSGSTSTGKEVTLSTGSTLILSGATGQ